MKENIIKYDDKCFFSIEVDELTQTETQNSNLTFEKVDERCKGCNHYKLTCDLFSEICHYEPKDEPQTKRIKTLDYCDICNHKGCKDCIANNLDDYCIPSHYAPKADTPQTEIQMETQNSNSTFEKIMEEIQTQVIEFPDTHQKFIFTRKIEMGGDSIKICGWEYKGAKDE